MKSQVLMICLAVGIERTRKKKKRTVTWALSNILRFLATTYHTVYISVLAIFLTAFHCTVREKIGPALPLRAALYVFFTT